MRSGIGCVHWKRWLVSKFPHWRQAWIAARQLGHCSSELWATGNAAPHAAHRESVRLSSIESRRGTSAGVGRGRGVSRRSDEPDR
jgi:hypothetical protein